MPGTNGGTGQPLYFRCSVCRAGGTYYREGFVNDVKLTGRVRVLPRGRGIGRNSDRAREYTCSCGHTGWSRHRDLERLEARLAS